jgi:HlyD family secretion protein
VDAFPGQEFKALITSVRFNPREVNNIVTYETVLTVANPDLLLRPGMTATADILVSELKDVLLVPNQALRFLPSEDAAISASEGDVIWIVEEGKAVSVPVTVGLSNGEVSEITGGNISAGTGVITDIEREARVPQGGGPF